MAARLSPGALGDARRALAAYRAAPPGSLDMPLRMHAVVDGLAALLGSIEPPGGER